MNYFPWNGSKRWLLPSLEPILKSWHGNGRYFEPFVGSGCVSKLVKDIHPVVIQFISDANPWLVSSYESQLRGCEIADNFIDLNYWRGLTDEQASNLSICERANRFAICLLTSWGNRWKSKTDGSMGSENPVNKKFADKDKLKLKLETFFKTKWLSECDVVECMDWKTALIKTTPGDLVYLDPPYPESLGYGNQWWSFSDQLDVVDWVADAVKRDVNVVVSNMATIERLYKRAGLDTVVVTGPKSSKTRKSRQEVIAWYIRG